jgi:hypothetical protein
MNRALVLVAALLVGCSRAPEGSAPDPTAAHTAAPAPKPARSFAEFRPSRDGFAFRNEFTGSPLPISLGSAEKKLGLPTRYGLCGGMSSAAADYFLSGTPLPADTAPPGQGTPLYTYLYSRQAATFGILGTMALRFIEWMRLPDDGPDGTRARTASELAPIEAALAAGKPILLGLVLVSAAQSKEPWQNHQVLAYAATRRGPVLDLAIYDPNFPKRDDAVIRVEERDGAPLCIRIVPGRRPMPVRGLFRMPYVPAVPQGL